MTKCHYPEPDVSEIIPGLWLGNERAAQNKSFLDSNNIVFIVRIMVTDSNYYKGKKEIGRTKIGVILGDADKRVHYVISVKDEHTCFIELNSLFDELCQFIVFALSYGQQHKCGILIHCKKGHHRSASVVGAFLIKHLNVDYVVAVSYINGLRRCALRRDTCMSKGLFRFYMNNMGTPCKDIACFNKKGANKCQCKK